MNAKTLKALKDSIAHWRRMRKNARGVYKATGESPSLGFCALCIVFDGDCDRCPVTCGLAWSDADRAWDKFVLGKRNASEQKWLDAADAEIAELVSHLPKKKKAK